MGTSPSGVAVGEGSVWVTNAGDATVSRINVDTNEVSQTLRVGSEPTGIAAATARCGSPTRSAARSSAWIRPPKRSTEIPLAGLPSSVAFTPDGVWVSIAPNSVARIDPTGSSVVFTQPVGSEPTAVVAAFDSIWVANHLDATVTRLDPSTGRRPGDDPGRPGPERARRSERARSGSANELDDAIAAIDPDRNTVAQHRAGGRSRGIARQRRGGSLAGRRRLGHRAPRRDPDRLLRGAMPGSIDPAVVYDTEGWRVLALTNDGLLAYKKVGGPDGATLVPDLASALPDVSADGLTYRFPLRDGIRYSTGEPVRPEDFRHGIERTLVLHPAGVPS